MPASTRRSSISAASPPTAEHAAGERERAAGRLFRPRRSTDELRHRSAAMTAASLLRETMWSMVSEIHSTLDFDYPAYTASNRARFEAAYAAFEESGMTLPASARVVVIGGGIVGCSTAYHLGAMGMDDVLLLERAQAHLRLHLARRRPRRAAPHQRQHHPAPRLFGRPLRPAGGRDRPRHRLEGNGGLRLACNAERWTEVKRQATTAHSLRPGDAPPVAEGGAGRSGR